MKESENLKSTLDAQKIDELKKSVDKNNRKLIIISGNFAIDARFC